MSEQTTILGVMPHTEELKTHVYHRLALVLWVLTFLPTFFYLFALVPMDGFSFKLWDFIGIMLFGYLTIPIIYRVLLYVFTGSMGGKK